MKFKTLRTIDKPIEFVTIQANLTFGIGSVYTSNVPILYPETADFEGLKEYFKSHSVVIDWSNIEMIEIDVIDAGVIGADIRNKLTPPNNLVALLEEYFSEDSTLNKDKLKGIIQKEMKNTKKSIKYLSKLL